VTEERPPLRVVAGDPTAEEVAALTVALAVARERAAWPAGDDGHRATAGWARRRDMLRAPLDRGPGAWRRSALPG
jgi:hypothetical protein